MKTAHTLTSSGDR